MRILTCLHTMEVGGSQINGIELAGRMAALGHEAVVYGPDGDLRPLVAELGLDWEEAPEKGPRLSFRSMARLRRIVRERRIDLIHAYEWAPTMDAAFGPHLIDGVPVVTTVLSPEVPDFVPAAFPMIVGVVELLEEESRRRPTLHLIEPPVDTELNAPVEDAARTAELRARFDVQDGEIAVVTVARLVVDLKREGILAAIEAVGAIGDEHRLRLIVVGDGPVRGELQAAADRVNAGRSRELVTLTGQMLDPRDAYAVADIVLGMGSSALRGMAFAKPLVVQGEKAFWRLLTPESLPFFLDGGWYSLGDGVDGPGRLAGILAPLAADAELRERLGALGREVVVERFSLAAAARTQGAIYAEAVAARSTLPRRLRALAHPAVRYAAYRLHPLKRRVLGLLGR
ncbi:MULTISPECIES: glycosyltransferase family 4 protein [unclassified Rathayibacter]|uniref:glycosyltransferase family 4 protein n=1 Tax=unclassified Rathayibacter TaxID=2609250 RepID=UPI000F4BD8FF|nr:MULTISPECIES: glycosyltransferase family 4 protein [unclassified Rathayibacter]ROP56645.1 glycosyltransferase involved in cell wall biosynthesis [Rathayibacter sp. PhB186]ROS55030.1 glycosyltransferase involved in cell wall biosynthesis [Rathayibacter sp. PhB185]